MRFDVITLFPQAFPGPLAVGVVGRALEAGLIQIEPCDLRGFGLGVHRQVDDIPFGGGPGMVLRPEPLFASVRSVSALPGLDPPHSILLSAHGRRLDAALVEELATSSTPGRCLLNHARHCPVAWGKDVDRVDGAG